MNKCVFTPFSSSKRGPIKTLIGYLLEKLSDFGVISKFEVLRERLINRDYFDHKLRFKNLDNKLNNLLQEFNKFRKAIVQFKKCLRFGSVDSLMNEELYSDINLLIGKCYINLGNYNTALLYLEKSKTLAEKLEELNTLSPELKISSYLLKYFSLD